MSEQPALPFPEPEGGPVLPPVAAEPVLELRGVTVRYGSVPALDRVSLRLRPGTVTCVLGENGAGKSTLVQVVSGVRRHDDGELLVDGKAVRFRRPRQARSRGIATIWQDLAVIPLMTVWRNFWLGDEPTRGVWPLRRIDLDVAREGAARALARVGLPDVNVNQPAAALQPGQRHSLAVARAMHFGARVLVVDEPAAPLTVAQHALVLRTVVAARDAGLGVLYVTSMPGYAHLVGDRFVLLAGGRVAADLTREDVDVDGLTRLMSGGEALATLTAELRRAT
ncbi:simple sugar transport system ATP-binding protein [Klenkia marina]|uniref:Simple sugar transport system ATP-binding protein n=1 Tax=Klenkia marina TaxID=1960309 RepID=A0A1G4XWF4_9ACTN|nr:ATP-binding cassette domain-containing protein [Klenkia marina]SCX45522.1 simple sugar transport system ATP-binding protein [Klenkia marina]